MKNYTLIHGDCLERLRELPDNSVDSIVTDPPAGIGFMGKEWDKDKGGRDSWIQWKTEIARECLRVLKHGGHAFVWALPRTSHWTAMAWENAGFEVRDKVCHAFGSGFPKSHDISKAIDREAGAVREVVGVNEDYLRRKPNGMKTAGATSYGYSQSQQETNADITAPATDAAKQWDGWGTALKPAVEDWWLLRKPIAEKTVAQNVLKYGTGAINIDACRVQTSKEDQDAMQRCNTPNSGSRINGGVFGGNTYGAPSKKDIGVFDVTQGRFPANLVLSDCDEVRECFPETYASNPNKRKNNGKLDDKTLGKFGAIDSEGYGDAGNASRFFKRIIYCAKASKSERNRGIENNHHPTVKPVALMQYLIQMITPVGGTVLDPFMGSGTTGVGAKSLGFGFIGIEREAEYLAIAQARIAAVVPNVPDLFNENTQDEC